MKHHLIIAILILSFFPQSNICFAEKDRPSRVNDTLTYEDITKNRLLPIPWRSMQTHPEEIRSLGEWTYKMAKQDRFELFSVGTFIMESILTIACLMGIFTRKRFRGPRKT
jgi:hypothetical protein